MEIAKDEEATIIARANFVHETGLLKVEVEYLISLKDTITGNYSPYPGTGTETRLTSRSPKAVADAMVKIKNQLRSVAEAAGVGYY